MALRLNSSVAHAEVQRQGRTVTEIAAHLSMERSYLSRCFSGTRIFPAEKIPALADFLGVDPYQLLGPENPRAAVLELARLYEITADELAVSA